jgi:hypothetical protein
MAYGLSSLDPHRLSFSRTGSTHSPASIWSDVGVLVSPLVTVDTTIWEVGVLGPLGVTGPTRGDQVAWIVVPAILVDVVGHQPADPAAIPPHESGAPMAPVLTWSDPVVEHCPMYPDTPRAVGQGMVGFLTAEVPSHHWGGDRREAHPLTSSQGRLTRFMLAPPSRSTRTWCRGRGRWGRSSPRAPWSSRRPRPRPRSRCRSRPSPEGECGGGTPPR